MKDNANTQATPKAGKGGVIPPADKQFGKPGGNPQGRGFWKKEDTARFKLEQMLKLTSGELNSVFEDEKTPLFERKLAKAIIDGEWKEIESMINQVYGYPKQTIDNNNIEVLPILPKPKKAKKK